MAAVITSLSLGEVFFPGNKLHCGAWRCIKTSERGQGSKNTPGFSKMHAKQSIADHNGQDQKRSG